MCVQSIIVGFMEQYFFAFGRVYFILRSIRRGGKRETFVSADRIGAHFAYRRRLITGGGFFGVALDDSRSFKHGVILGFSRRKCGERGGKEKNNISGIALWLVVAIFDDVTAVNFLFEIGIVVSVGAMAGLIKQKRSGRREK